MAVTKMSPAEAYRRAAFLLERDGWVRGRGYGLGGSRCMAQAVFDAAGRNRSAGAAHDLFAPLADWLVDNRRADIVRGLRVAGYTPGDPTMARTLRKEWTESYGSRSSVRAVRAVERWNDLSGPLTREDVTAVLYAAAAEGLRGAAGAV